VIAFQLAFTKF